MYFNLFPTHYINVREVKYMKKSNSQNQNKSNNSKNAIEKMKYEIASELGVTMGPDATSRANGAVGGEITKRLVQMGEDKMNRSNK